MLLPGKLSRSSLGDILGALLRAEVSGVLELTDAAGQVHHIHLVEGAPRVVASRGPRIGEILASWGGVAAELVRRAEARQEAGDPRLFGEILRELGASDDALVTALARQCKERLDRLFVMSDARIAFRTAGCTEGGGPAWSRASRAAKGLEPEEFLEGRPRARERRPPVARDGRAEAYRMMGLTEGAPMNEVRARYKQLVLELHPDRANNESDRRDRNARLARVTAAYQRIRDAAARSAA